MVGHGGWGLVLRRCTVGIAYMYAFGQNIQTTYRENMWQITDKFTYPWKSNGKIKTNECIQHCSILTLFLLIGRFKVWKQHPCINWIAHEKSNSGQMVLFILLWSDTCIDFAGTYFLCRLKRRHIGITFVGGVGGVVVGVDFVRISLFGA